MKFLSQFFFGLKSYWKAILFIKEQKFYWYIFIPAIFMLGIYKIGAIIQQRTFDLQAENMNEIVWQMIQLLFEISIALLFMNFAKYVVVIILSPLLAHLSQKTERILTGNKYPFHFNQFLKDIKRGIRIVLRNFFWQYLFFVIIFLVAMIGWKDPKSSPVFYLIFIIAFYYYGFSFIDYINERRKLNIDESIIFVRSNSGFAISIGLIYSLLIFVPVDLNIVFNLSGFKQNGFLFGLGQFIIHITLWISASAAPILAIVASTIGMNELASSKSSKRSK